MGMIWTFIVLAILAALIHFSIPTFSKRYGAAVKARFVERANTIPGQANGRLDQESLKEWISSNTRSARGYAFPVLFPLDFLFLLALGGALACGSAFFAAHAMFVSAWAQLIWFILPLIYVATDLIEDTLLIWVFNDAKRLTPGVFATLAFMTALKIKSVIAGFAQFAVLLALAAAKLCVS